MNDVRLAVAFGSLFLGVCVGFVACGGDDSSGGAGGPDGSVGGGDSGNGIIDAGAFDAHPRPSDPKRVQCGGANSCNTDTSSCCASDDGGFTCVGQDADCNGFQLPCEETADCSDNQVCCGTIDPTTTELSVDCADSCGGQNARRLCKSDQDCGDAGACVTQQCLGTVVSTCGGIPQQYCEL